LEWLFLAALPALLFVVIAVPKLRDFFALEFPSSSAWAAILVIVAGAAAALVTTERSGFTPMVPSTPTAK
jgi:hypothetical protein